MKERYPRVARYYTLVYDPQTATLVSQFDADKHAKAERLDGCYLLKTSRKDQATNSGASMACSPAPRMRSAI